MSGGSYFRNWLGSSPYEQVLQHKSTLLALYNIPRNASYTAGPRGPVRSDEFAFIDGFFGGFRLIREDSSGWIFGHGGSILLAARTIQPGEWLRSDDLLQHTTLGRCYRSHGHKNAAIVEVAPSAASSDTAPEGLLAELDAFAEAIRNTVRIDDSGMQDDQPTILYTDRHGHTLELQYNGGRKIDGLELGFDDWPLLRNPWVNAEIGRGELHWLRRGSN